MKLIVITHPEFIQDEAEIINSLFAAGLQYLHLRKPSAGIEEVAQLLEKINPRFHSRIVIHDHYRLVQRFSLLGIHLNDRNLREMENLALEPFSRSCHSLEEVAIWKEKVRGYVLLSPIFDSISKTGYKAAFNHCELMRDNRIDDKVMALGGVTPSNIANVKGMGFGGAAVLGSIWKEPSAALDSYREIENMSKGKCAPLQFITHQNERYTTIEGALCALEGGCRWIQLRMKDATYNQVLDKAMILKELCRRFDARLIVDDWVKVCQVADLDGVHLGKQDISPDKAREILGASKIIGGTANTIEDVCRLHSLGVDYIGMGPFRFTSTKKNLSAILGLEGYQQIISQMRSRGITTPVVAIGGIRNQDIAPLMQTGIEGIALSSSILDWDDAVARTKEINELININLK